MILIWAILGLVCSSIVIGAHLARTGRLTLDPLQPAVSTRPDLGLPAMPMSEDIMSLTFDAAPVGYDPAAVDARLDELRATLRVQEHEILGLRMPEDRPLDPDARS